MDRPHLPPHIFAGGDSSNAAGRDVFVTNNHGTKGFHADSETFADLIEKRYQSQQEIQHLRQVLLQYERFVDEKESELSEWKRAAATERQKVASAGQEIARLRTMPVVPTARVVQWGSGAVVAAAILVLLVAQIAGHNVQVDRVAVPGPTVTVTGPADVASTTETDPLASGVPDTAGMTCTPGSVIVQLGVYEPGAAGQVLTRAKLLTIGQEIAHTQVTTSVQATSSDSVCTNTQPTNPLGIPGTRDYVVWAGPFSSLPAANAFCSAMGWNPLIMTSCYTHQLQ